MNKQQLAELASETINALNEVFTVFNEQMTEKQKGVVHNAIAKLPPHLLEQFQHNEGISAKQLIKG